MKPECSLNSHQVCLALGVHFRTTGTDSIFHVITDETPTMPNIVSALARYLYIYISIAPIFLAIWIVRSFGTVEIDQVIVTLRLGIIGLDDGLVRSFFKWVAAVPLGFTSAVWILLNVRLSNHFRIALLISLVFLSGALSHHIAIKQTQHETDWSFFERNYVTPEMAVRDVSVNKPKNLIWIIVESLENSYTDPLINSDLDAATGFMSALVVQPITMTYTVGAIMAMRCGVPLNGFALIHQNFFLKGPLTKAVCIDDVLQQNGYVSTFMSGHDADFSGLGSYFKSHAQAQVLDGKWMLQKKLPKLDIYSHFNDETVFEQAYLKLSDIKEKSPFSLTILTFDNHIPKGLPSKHCLDTYGEYIGDVIRCNNSAVAKFVGQLRSDKQLMENTTIVITGDHPFMGAFDELTYPRSIYAKIFSPSSEPLMRKAVTQFDFYPTVLHAMNVKTPAAMALGRSAYKMAEFESIRWQADLRKGFSGTPPQSFMDLQ